MSPQPASTSSSTIVWPSVITVISAAILIGAEVFGAAFAGGWALAILFGLDDTAAHILQAVLFAIGVLIMAAFIRAAQRIEPFFKRAWRAFKKALRHRRWSAHTAFGNLNTRSCLSSAPRAENAFVSTR
jgi:nitric oxide reductase large subunit